MAGEPGDTTDSTLPINDIAECFCDVYSGEPWNQTFNQEEIVSWLEDLSKQPGVKIEYITEKDSPKVIAFYIAQEGTFDQVASTFIESSREALKSPIKNIDLSPSFFDIGS